jgi:hypothetical protein
MNNVYDDIGIFSLFIDLKIISQYSHPYPAEGVDYVHRTVGFFADHGLPTHV